MTEKLATLLHDYALRADLPGPDLDAITRAGRHVVRRRRVGTAVAGFTVVAVLGGFVVGLAGHGPQTASDPLGTAAGEPLATWAAATGSEVRLGDGSVVDLGAAVKSLYYTSAGVVARTGATATTDSADSTYRLVTSAGVTGSFDLDLGDRVPGTDPELPLIAYAAATGDPASWEVVVRDVRTGEVLTRVRTEGAFTWGGWVAPPVSLSGDHVYVGLDDATLDIAWRTGAVRRSTVLPAGRVPEVSAGRAVIESETRYSVVDAQTGEVLSQGSLGAAATAALSPDGRYGLLVPWRTCQDAGSCVFDVSTTTLYDVDHQTAVSVQLGDGVGWTPRGDLLRIDGNAVSTCDPVTSFCEKSGVDLGPGTLRLAGTSYEA